MKVAGTNSACYAPSSATTSRDDDAATDFLALLAAHQADTTSPADASTDATATNVASAVEPLDFTNMTRQRLRDWVNDEIRSGRMTLEEGGSFIGMTIHFPTADQPVDDCPNDPTRFDFLERMRDGIEGALWRHDQAAADRYRTALAQMQAAQLQAAQLQATPSA